MAIRNATKRLLADHLKAQMQQKSLDKIAIADITNAAGVNRQTFYYHFKDIFDLLKWTLQQETILPLQEQTINNWQQALLGLFTYLDENRAFALSAVHSLGQDPFKRFFYTEVNEIITDVIENLSETLDEDEEYAAFLSHFYTVSLSSLALSWLQGEMDATPEQIIAFIDRAINEQRVGANVLFQSKLNEKA